MSAISSPSIRQLQVLAHRLAMRFAISLLVIEIAAIFFHATQSFGFQPVLVFVAQGKIFGDSSPLALIIEFVVTVVVAYAVGLWYAWISLRPVRDTLTRMEQFTQDVSHELKTPIATIATSLELAEKTRKYAEASRLARTELRRMADLLSRLLQLTRIDKFTLDLSSCDLDVIGKDLLESLMPLAEQQGVSLTYHPPRHGTSVRADRVLFYQAAYNLLTNAIKFTNPGGTVELHITRTALRVVDTGIGMNKQAIERIFDRFYQADPSRSGAGFGLGLSFVHQVVELHGWKLLVRSEPGIGSTFTIRFVQPQPLIRS